MKGTKSYSVLKEFNSLEARYDYLKLGGQVGKQTFGWDRYFNQRFYHSTEWKAVRHQVILRDNGCDLGIEGFEIGYKILIHHMNPIWVEDLRHHNPDVLNPEFLICVSQMTHQAIHYGDRSLLPQEPIQRKPGDTKLW
jgi:hypothetical protein